MRTVKVWISLFVLMSGLVVWAQESGVSPAGKQFEIVPPDNNGGAIGDRWAIVIGLNYKNWKVPELQYACNDATHFAECLKTVGFKSDHVFVMTDDSEGVNSPITSNIRDRLTAITGKVKKDDLLIVYYSGHGTNTGYLLPLDTAADGKDTTKMIAMSLVKELLETSAAKQRLLILDACHSGGKDADASSSAADNISRNFDKAGFLTMSSCDASQLSYENDAEKLGVFTAELIKGLAGMADMEVDGNKDHKVTVHELFGYVVEGVANWCLANGKEQTPILRGYTSGQMILANRDPWDTVLSHLGAIAQRLDEIEVEMDRRPDWQPVNDLELALAVQEEAIGELNAKMKSLPAEPDRLTPYNEQRERAIQKTAELRALMFDICSMPTYVNSIGMKLVHVQPGTFLQGSDSNEEGHDESERPRHKVILTKSFFIGACEVTQGQWERLMETNPSTYKQLDPNFPIVDITWDQAKTFCSKLSLVEGRTYRLPTEAEWEYACRATIEKPNEKVRYTAYNNGNDNMSGVHQICRCSYPLKVKSPGLVGALKPNRWQLYDMHGNVAEWCEDSFGNYSDATAVDPLNTQGTTRVVRGGSWRDMPFLCRSAARRGVPAKGSSDNLGFRVVLVVDCQREME